MVTRALSALFGMAALYGAWHFGDGEGLAAVCVLVTLVSTIEFSVMVASSRSLIRSLFVTLCFCFYLVFSFYSQSILVFLSFFVLLVTYFVLFTDYPIEKRMIRLTTWTVGILYCGVFTGMVTLGTYELGGLYFLALCLVSFVNDTFAYFGGRFLGKRPLAPMISPNKTIEGSLFGLIGGAGTTFWFLQMLDHNSPLWVLIITCVSACLFSQVGDLFESMIKRHSGMKDSGKIMPGHGGFLDRIDGLLFAGPVIYLWMTTYLN